MKTWKRGVSVAIVAWMVAATAGATEGGGGAYPNGAEGFMTGALPPPGDYLINYALYYTADALKDGDGRRVPIDFDLEVAGVVLRYIHVTGKTILGASWAQHVFVPLLNVDVATPGGSDNKFGLGDIIVDPFILGWHRPPFHVAAGVDVYLPVGAYDEDDMANVGRNYWTVEPVLACTYLDRHGIEVSGKLMYDINLENSDTDYESGDELHLDYAVGLHVGKWTVGVGGFCYEQVGDDKGPAGTVPVDGNKGKQFAWGPQVAYQCGNVGLVLAYQDETETENKPEGERVWFKLIAAL